MNRQSTGVRGMGHTTESTMARVIYDPMWNEPKQRKYYAIKCFDCNREVKKDDLKNNHQGHDVHYVDAKGQIDE